MRYEVYFSNETDISNLRVICTDIDSEMDALLITNRMNSAMSICDTYPCGTFSYRIQTRKRS